MSYAPTNFSRSRHHSHAGYGPAYNNQGYPTQVGYNQGGYGGEYRGEYGGDYGGQHPPQLSRRYSSRDQYPSSHIGQGYTTVAPVQYVSNGSRSYRHHPSSHHSHSRHHSSPNVVVTSAHNLGHHSTTSYSHVPTSSSRYYAEGSGGRSVPVIAGRSYREEQVPLSTRIRRLFGLGPKHSSGYHGRSVHVKRGRQGSYFTTLDRGTRRGSEAAIYTV